MDKTIEECIKKFQEVFPDANIVPIKWNPRMRTTAGRVKLKNRKPYVVELNPHALTDDEKIKATLLHELAHVADAQLFGNIGHGRTWKHCMLKMGQQPRRCHTYEVSHLKRKESRHEAYCGCEKPHKITTTRRNKMKRGTNYRCRQCNERLVLEQPEIIAKVS